MFDGDVSRGVKYRGHIISVILTRLLRDGFDTTKNQRADEIASLLRYMSPGRIGIIEAEVDAPSDLYSLGILFYELITGIPPFAESDHAAIIHSHMVRIPQNPVQVNRAVTCRDLLVIHELYRQQKEMYDMKKYRVESRIVSIAQPHVRHIVRGKVSAPVEFGVKVGISLVDGYTFIDHLSWENFNESQYLKDQISEYYKRFGCLPESINTDKIYRNRENRNYCKGLEIRLSGPALGRLTVLSRDEKKQMREDSSVRNALRGNLGKEREDSALRGSWPNCGKPVKA